MEQALPVAVCLASLGGAPSRHLLARTHQLPPCHQHVCLPLPQLYVSVDAATKESLKAIDRPLFGDFWERFTVRHRAAEAGPPLPLVRSMV